MGQPAYQFGNLAKSDQRVGQSLRSPHLTRVIGHRAAHCYGEQVGQIVHVRGVVYREAHERIALGRRNDQPQVVRLRLALRLRHRPEVGLPGHVGLL